MWHGVSHSYGGAAQKPDAMQGMLRWHETIFSEAAVPLNPQAGQSRWWSTSQGGLEPTRAGCHGSSWGPPRHFSPMAVASTEWPIEAVRLQESVWQPSLQRGPHDSSLQHFRSGESAATTASSGSSPTLKEDTADTSTGKSPVAVSNNFEAAEYGATTGQSTPRARWPAPPGSPPCWCPSSPREGSHLHPPPFCADDAVAALVAKAQDQPCANMESITHGQGGGALQPQHSSGASLTQQSLAWMGAAEGRVLTGSRHLGEASWAVLPGTPVGGAQQSASWWESMNSNSMPATVLADLSEAFPGGLSTAVGPLDDRSPQQWPQPRVPGAPSVSASSRVPAEGCWGGPRKNYGSPNTPLSIMSTSPMAAKVHSTAAAAEASIISAEGNGAYSSPPTTPFSASRPSAKQNAWQLEPESRWSSVPAPLGIVSTCPAQLGHFPDVMAAAGEKTPCSPAGSLEADALRSMFRASGMPLCADLVTHLRAAVPEVYED